MSKQVKDAAAATPDPLWCREADDDIECTAQAGNNQTTASGSGGTPCPSSNSSVDEGDAAPASAVPQP